MLKLQLGKNTYYTNLSSNVPPFSLETNLVAFPKVSCQIDLLFLCFEIKPDKIILTTVHLFEECLLICPLTTIN